MKEAKKRDYKDEYKKFQSSAKSKKYRAELNKYNRKKGTYGNGDDKDASHKGGKIVGFESQSKNRGRAEKSRLKKESTLNENPAAIAAVQAMVKLKMKNPKTGKDSSAVSALKNKDNPNHKKAKSIFQRLKDKFSKKKDDKPKKQSKSDADFYKRQYEFVKEAKFDATGIDWSDEMMWKWVSKALKTAGIKELKYTPMKSGWLGGKFIWGGFYQVQANKRQEILPITIDKKGNIHLNVSPKKFVIGKIGKLPQVVKNLKDFKKSDLDVNESVNEDYKISVKHTFKVTPDGGIILYGRHGKIMMNREEIKSFLRGLKMKHIPESVNEAISGFQYQKNIIKRDRDRKAKEFQAKQRAKGLKWDEKKKRWVKKESVNESRANVVKAIAIAKKMSGNMTGAVKKIEKIQKGLSKQIEVEDALRKANESVNEAKSKTIKTIGSIIGKRQAKKIDGVLVDMQTAHVIMKVWNALSSSNRKKFEKLPIKQMATVAWKLVK